MTARNGQLFQAGRTSTYLSLRHGFWIICIERAATEAKSCTMYVIFAVSFLGTFLVFLLRYCLNVFIEGHTLIWSGREFHSWAVLGTNEFWCKVVLDIGIWKLDPLRRFLFFSNFNRPFSLDRSLRVFISQWAMPIWNTGPIMASWPVPNVGKL